MLDQATINEINNLSDTAKLFLMGFGAVSAIIVCITAQLLAAFTLWRERRK